MFHSFFALTVLIALAGRAFALNIVFGAPLGNITASQMLQIPQGPYSSTCQSMCNTANSSITTCGNNNNQCLCTNTIASQLQQCEQCLFNELIALNIAAPDPRVGSATGLTDFVTACMTDANITLTAQTLTLPANWEGPRDIILNTGATVVVFGFGAILAGTSLWMLSNI